MECGGGGVLRTFALPPQLVGEGFPDRLQQCLVLEGLGRKSIAPAFMRTLMGISPWPVMKMMGSGRSAVADDLADRARSGQAIERQGRGIPMLGRAAIRRGMPRPRRTLGSR